MKNLGIVFFAFILFSCGEKKQVKIPENILSKEKMVAVMVDIHIVEASMNLNLIPSGSITPKSEYYYSILKSNHITKKQYDESSKFYFEHVELLNEVYEGVLKELSKKQAEEINKK